MKAAINTENEVSRTQKEYRDLANLQTISNADQIRRRGLFKTLNLTKDEKHNLSINFSAASSKCHTVNYERDVKRIQKNVANGESIMKMSNKFKSEINHLKMQINRIDAAQSKQEKSAVSDNQYSFNVKQAKITVKLLNDRLYEMRCKENVLMKYNSKLQEIVRNLTCDRVAFNKLWKNTIHRLGLDKKMLVDMVDQAVYAFEKGTEFCKRIEFISKQAIMSKHMHIDEMSYILQWLELDKRTHYFFGNKLNKIQSKTLDSKEIKRRNNFKNEHQQHIQSYQKIMDTVKQFSGETSINRMLEQFRRRKSEYFSYYCYLNDLNKYILYLNKVLHMVNQHIQVVQSTDRHHKTKLNEENLLNARLNENKFAYQRKLSDLNTIENDLMNYYSQFDLLIEILKCENIEKYLVKEFENETVMFHNIKEFMGIIEKRIKEIISWVYYVDRMDNQLKSHIVQDTEVINYRLNEEAILSLVYQCPECAEAEDTTGHESQEPMNPDEIRKNVKSKTVSPEMQYRMHSISQCDLPVSRALLAKTL